MPAAVGPIWIDVMTVTTQGVDVKYARPIRFEPDTFELSVNDPTYSQDGAASDSGQRSLLSFRGSATILDRDTAEALLAYRQPTPPVMVAYGLHQISDPIGYERPTVTGLQFFQFCEYVNYYPLIYAAVYVDKVEELACGYRFDIAIDEVEFIWGAGLYEGMYAAHANPGAVSIVSPFFTGPGSAYESRTGAGFNFTASATLLIDGATLGGYHVSALMPAGSFDRISASLGLVKVLAP